MREQYITEAVDDYITALRADPYNVPATYGLAESKGAYVSAVTAGSPAEKAGLLPEDFGVLASRGASIVWSPFSNLLLYGGTARVEAAKAAGMRCVAVAQSFPASRLTAADLVRARLADVSVSDPLGAESGEAKELL